MSDVSKQKVEYVSHNPNIKRGNSTYVELTYKRLDGENAGKISTTGAFVAQLDQESKALIKKGGTFVITKTKSGNFWNLTKVEDISTWVDKPQSVQKSYTNKGQPSTYNQAGVKVGAVLHDAVAIYAASGTAKPDTELNSIKGTLKIIAEELLTLSYELEANVNAGKYEPKDTTTEDVEESVIGHTEADISNISW